MTAKRPALLGVYATHASLETGVQALRHAGFRPCDISVHPPGHLGLTNQSANPAKLAPEGAAMGASTGALVGGVIGLSASVGSLGVQALRQMAAAGPLLAALVGAAAGGIMGGVSGGLLGRAVSRPAPRYDDPRITAGGTLLSVHTGSPYWKRRALEILETTGAQEISSNDGSSITFDNEDCHLPSAF